MGYLAVGCGAVLVVVFAAAVIGKARDPAAFARSLVETRLVTRRWRTWVATGVLVTETAVVVLLLVPGLAVYGFAAATALSAALTAVAGITVARRVQAPCLCFGGPAQPMGPVHVVRNAVLTGTGVLGLLTGGPAAQFEGVAVAALTGAVGALLLIRLDDLRSVFR